MSQPLSIVLAPSAARVADGTGDPVDLGLVGNVVPRSAARLTIDVTAFAQLERVRLMVDTAPSEAGPWLELDALDLEQTDEYDLSVGNTKRWLRLRWELTGADDAPSVTFSIEGEAHQVYVSPRGLKSAIRVVALDEITTLTARADACIAVSDEADGYLGGAYALPMLKWDNALSAKCAHMAIKYSLDACGWQPEGPDSVIKDNFEQALAWLKRLQAGNLKPPGMVDSTPQVFEGGSVVVSKAPRRPL